jgi:hypothetical protein
MRLILKTLLLMALAASAARAARFPMLGGPGLVHLQSAKAGQGFGLRLVNSFSAYDNQRFYLLEGQENSFQDIWSRQLLSYSPAENLSFMAGGLAHLEMWNIASPGGDSLDNSLGCPGDVTLAAKYSFSLANRMADLALMPMVSVPMDKEKYQDSPSQTGKLDFGAKLLGDLNLKRHTLYANLGFLTRGDQRPQLPAGVGYEFGLSRKFSAFAEASAELRMGAAKDSLPDSLVRPGRGYDRTEARITPGLHFVPFDLLGISLSADLGLTKATAPWQITLGLDFPASAGRAVTGVIGGVIAGLIKDRDTGVPMKGMITFPGADLPGTVSDDIGTYLAELPPGEYKIHIYANGYRWIERKIKVEPGKKEKWDLTLKRKLGTIKGTAVDAVTGSPVAAAFSFVGRDLPEFSADPASGEFASQVPPGKYSLSVTAPGYQAQTLELTVRDRKDLASDIRLQPDRPAALAARTQRPAPPVPAGAPPEPARSAAAAPAAPRAAAPKAEPKPAAAPAAKMTPDQINELYKAGVKQYMNEEYEKAAQTFQKVLKAEPGNAKAKDYLGKARDRLKKIKG